MTSYLLIFFAAVASLHFADSRECYTCTSITDPGCADLRNLDKSKTVTCTIDPKRVMTYAFFDTARIKLQDWSRSMGFNIAPENIDPSLVCSKIDITERNNTIVIRGCSLPAEDTFDPCDIIREKYVSDIGNVTFCGICNTDICNASTTHKVSPVMLLPLIPLIMSYNPY